MTNTHKVKSSVIVKLTARLVALITDASESQQKTMNEICVAHAKKFGVPIVDIKMSKIDMKDMLGRPVLAKA